MLLQEGFEIACPRLGPQGPISLYYKMCRSTRELSHNTRLHGVSSPVHRGFCKKCPPQVTGLQMVSSPVPRNPNCLRVAESRIFRSGGRHPPCHALILALNPRSAVDPSFFELCKNLGILTIKQHIPYVNLGSATDPRFEI